MNASGVVPNSASSSSTLSTTPLRTPASPSEENVFSGYGQYTSPMGYVFQHPGESPSLDGLLGLPDAIHTGVQEYVSEGGRSPRISRRNRFKPYEISPGLRGKTRRIHEVMHPPDWLLAAESIPAVPWEPTTFGSTTGGDLENLMQIPAWQQGVNESRDVPLDTYSDAEYIGQVPSGTSVATTVACLDTIFEEALCVDPRVTLIRGDRENTERGAAVAKPGGQAPAFADDSLAPRRPHIGHPSDRQSATASGYSPEQRVLSEVGSGTNPTPASNVVPDTQRRRRRRRRADKPVTPFVCEDCTVVERSEVSFNCMKDLKRHQATTVTHNAPEILFCSCGKGVTRKDAMTLHHRYCNGHTQEPGEAATGRD
jgi:hypothetical protein